MTSVDDIIQQYFDGSISESLESNPDIFKYSYVFAYTNTGSNDIELPFLYSNEFDNSEYLYSYIFKYTTYVYRDGTLSELENNTGTVDSVIDGFTDKLIISDYGTIGKNDILFVSLDNIDEGSLYINGINYSSYIFNRVNTLRGIKWSRRDIYDSTYIDTMKIANNNIFNESNVDGSTGLFTLDFAIAAGSFNGCTSLKIWYDENKGSTLLDENMTKLNGMFYKCPNFNGDISLLNTINISNMKYMFNDASSFNQDIGKWNVSSVTDMSDMFNNASSFNQDISEWNIINVVYFDSRVASGTLDIRLYADSISGKTQYVSYNRRGFMYKTNLSPENYDKILISWANKINEDVVLIDFYPAKHSNNPEVIARRNFLKQEIPYFLDGGTTNVLNDIFIKNFTFTQSEVDEILNVNGSGFALIPLLKASITVNQFIKQLIAFNYVDEEDLINPL